MLEGEEVTVSSTETPEEVLETLNKFGTLREDLGKRLGALKIMLENIEETQNQQRTDADQVNLSLNQVQHSVGILSQILHDCRGCHPELTSDDARNKTRELELKILNVYDNIVDKLGR